MKALKVKLQYYDGTNWINLTSWKNISITRNTDPTTNTMNISLNIIKDITTSTGFTFSKNTKIKCYAKYFTGKGDLTDSDLLFYGDIVGINQDVKSNEVALRCVDHSYRFVNRMVVQAYKASSGWTAPTILKNVLGITTDSETGDGTTLIDATLVNYPSTDGIQNTRPDGSAFPTIDFGTNFKAVTHWISQISSKENCATPIEIELGTSPVEYSYTFYIDENNKAHWFHPTTTVNTTLDKNDLDVLSITIEDNAMSEVTYLIIDCGTNNSGNSIYAYVFNEEATTATTQKDTFRSRIDIAKTMKTESQWISATDENFNAEARRRARIYAEQEFRNKDGADNLNVTFEGQQITIGTVFSLDYYNIDDTKIYKTEQVNHSISDRIFTTSISAKEVRL